ncbi:MAG: succinate dehydrogenase/fumarate reductase iron-sulfur subunit [Syntrophorhabdus sp. PtaU1.Bin153]|nr:MAG: succinate dehydrogenase/fumarate reductase iron-sulfur subunit [Syntrophorhabdus sp. PtaU1.Bin153]
MGKKKPGIRDFGRNGKSELVHISQKDLMPLPDIPGEDTESDPIRSLTDRQKATYEHSLDGVSAVAVPCPKDEEEEKRLIKSFLEGLKKLLSREDNWMFLQQLQQTLDCCIKCQVCSDACAIYVASGRQEIYRPMFRSEVVRRIVNKYLKKGGRLFAKLRGNDIELNWTTIARLAELAYRCTMCRRCAAWCPMGSDSGLITHELRKLFSQEMGIAPKELHEAGSMRHLRVGASTGISPKAFGDIIAFMEEEIEEKTGKKIKIPVDKKGAEILLIHNSGEYLSWIENPAAFAVIFEEAGLNWTLSSELYGYEATNYGVWYDDVQFGRVALRQIEVAKKLEAKKIVIGECGHATKGLVILADRMLTGDFNFPRESALPLLENIVCTNRIRLDPRKNDFPVTLHDPCNIVRLMGIIEPQRKILHMICPRFREMEPHGVDNYCCGGGSGFAIMSHMNFSDWKLTIAGRIKVKQILDAFKDVRDPSVKKYVCAPCSNCKAQLRDLLAFYNLQETHGISYGGLAELIANAMVDLKKPFIEW